MVVCGLGASLLATPQVQKPPVFKGGIDLHQIDVTVRDKNRRPVKGLTAADFTLLEDNVPQKIESFSFVDLPDVVTEQPVWANRAASDVVSNQLTSARTFVIVVDDNAPGDLWAQRELKKGVANFVDQLGPNDVAALVYPARSHPGQSFTRDHAKLVAAAQPLGTTTVGALGYCEPARLLPETMLYLAQDLGTIPGSRKVIVYLGGGLHIEKDAADECGAHKLWMDLFAAAQQQHVSIYPIDTMGLLGGRQRTVDDYLTVAHETGGRAVINSNSFDEGIARIFAENDSYYLLAYQPTNVTADGRFRRVSVKVNRPDVEVTATRNYWAPKALKPGETAPEPPPPDLEALAGVLPMAELKLRAVATPFATAGDGASTIALAVRLDQPPFAVRTPETVDVLVKAQSSDGLWKGSDDQTVQVTVPAARSGASSPYEVLLRLEVPKPGGYEVRVAAHSEATDTSGSIFLDVVVPDFQNDAVSMSGVVMSRPLAPGPVAPARVLQDILRPVPTTEREFGSADSVMAFVRVYQAVEKPASVPINVSIQDATGKRAFNKSDTLKPEAFGDARAADYQFLLPLETLKAGEYLLTLEIARGKVTVRRDVRFSVK
ncbi:MAG TPA: VWA domain-containing protein [Vicinamibacterales bacterium]|nr:VWA domain-containing protein [Vicinamibacterales bacterium]